MSYLQMEIPRIFIKSLGSMIITLVTADAIVLSGNQLSKMDNYYWYTVTLSGTTWSFRFTGKSYNAGNNLTNLSNCQWYKGLSPTVSSATSFVIEQFIAERATVFGRTLCTIGDSLTYSKFGSTLRDQMRDSGLRYDFSGNNIDPFGWRHCGNGGDTTQQMIDKLDYVPTSDSYHILGGTNDYALPDAQDTVDHILTMVDYLHNRNSSANINISTIPLRSDPSYNTRINDVNTLLRNLSLAPKVYIIDLQAQLPALGTWSTYLTDGVHPNFAGYTLVADILSSDII